MVDNSDLNLDFKLVRQELRELKSCQITFLSISITATALILSVSNKFLSADGNGLIPSFVFLTPLVILIPAGIVFFDKAVTISRAVGYIRILEALKTKKISSDNYCGFENSLGLWRNYPFEKFKETLKERVKNMRSENSNRLQKNFEKKYGLILNQSEKLSIRWLINKIPNEFIRKFIDLVFLFSPLRYWMIIFYVFTGLSAACLYLGIENYGGFLKIFHGLSTSPLFSSPFAFLLIIIIYCLFFLYLAYFIWNLIYGHFSYDYNEEIWKDVLEVYVNKSEFSLSNQ
jgi:hypothetical protein